MGIKFFYLGINKYLSKLNRLSSFSGISRFALYVDCFWSYLRYGCVLNHYILGNFYMRRFYERDRILTYRRWQTLLKYNDKNYIYLLKNKAEFNKYFYDYIGREWLYSKDLTYEDFISFLERHLKFFLKPVGGKEGEDCQIVYYDNKTNYYNLYEYISSNGYLIEEVINQHPLLFFANESVNTIRVYTIYDKQIGKAFCIKTTLRVGIGRSIVDNSHSGGISYEVDVNTGIIDSRGWKSSSMERNLFHPGTDICMIGRKIPYWKEVLHMCESAASMIPQVQFVGWDVAISIQGPLLIEGNNTPDIDIMEFVGNYGYYDVIMSHLKY